MAANNQLTTGTLVASDLRNRSHASVSSSSLSLSSDMLDQGKYGLAKAALGHVVGQTERGFDAQSTTASVVSPAHIVITDEAAQRQASGQSSAETIAGLRRDANGAHQALLQADLQQLQQEVDAVKAIKDQLFATVASFTDEAYRSRMQARPQYYKVECPTGADCIKNPALATTRPATAEEIANAPAGSIVAVNGIFNGQARAGQLTFQNVDSDLTKTTLNGGKPDNLFLMHIDQASNGLSEMLGVAYEKFTASVSYGLADAFGYTLGQEAYADLLRSRGQQETVSMGHSRGTLVQEAAFTILANWVGVDGAAYINPDLWVRGVGGASNALEFTGKASNLLGNSKRLDQVSFSYFSNDPVSTSAGGNPGFWNFGDLWSVIKTDNNMHSCYGTGASGCRQVENPVPGGPQGTPEGNATLIRYEGGVVVRSPSLMQSPAPIKP